MSDRDFRRLTRELAAQGRLGDFAVEAILGIENRDHRGEALSRILEGLDQSELRTLAVSATRGLKRDRDLRTVADSVRSTLGAEQFRPWLRSGPSSPPVPSTRSDSLRVAPGEEGILEFRPPQGHSLVIQRVTCRSDGPVSVRCDGRFQVVHAHARTSSMELTRREIVRDGEVLSLVVTNSGEHEAEVIVSLEGVVAEQ